MKRAVFFFLLATAVAHADAGADAHMRAGAQHFQAGRFSEALVEFRVAERLAEDAGPRWYVAATLVKLKRPEEALTAFARAEASAPADRDALFDYYHALACYDARLYRCVDRLLAAVGDGAGPRIAAQARKIRADLVPVLSQAAPASAIDWYHARGQAARKAGEDALAAAYFEEAVELAGTDAHAYRRAEALDALARARAALAQSESKR
jgi:tetratricopeptide (TPR) repeat protein